MKISTWIIYFLSSSKTVNICCQTTSYSSKMAHRPIRLSSLKNGSSSIVQSSSRRMSGPQTHQTSILSTTTSVGAVLEMYKVFTPKPTNKAELETVLEAIWEDLPQESIDLAVLAFRKRLQVVHSSRWRSLWTPTQIESTSSKNGPFQGQKSIQKDIYDC